MIWHNLTLDLLNFSERDMPYVIGIGRDSEMIVQRDLDES